MISDRALQSAAYWRDRAEEARAKAGQMHSEDARSTMLGIAHGYDLMALRADGREAPPGGEKPSD
jgi:hypothetical protein